MISLYSVLIVATFVWLAPTVILLFAVACLLGSVYRFIAGGSDSEAPILKKFDHAVIAHRAAAKANAKNPSCRVPENTLEALDVAKKVHGVNSVEFDVACTLDGVPVVFHDQVLGRTLDVSPEDGSRGIPHFTYNQIRKMKFRSEHVGENSLNSYVPTLEETVIHCKNLGLNMMIEVKPLMSDRNCKTVVDIILRHNIQDSCYVASFDPIVLYRIRKYGQRRITTGFLFSASVIDLLQLELERQQKTVPPMVMRIATFPLTKLIIDSLFHFLGSPFVLNILGHKVVAAQYTYLSTHNVRKYREAGITVLGWTFDEGSEDSQRVFFNETKISLITDFPVAELIARGSDNPSAVGETNGDNSQQKKDN